VELAVAEGDRVAEGDIIARLETTMLDADVARAEAALAVAEANLDRARTGARLEEIAQAEHDLEAANAGVAQAVAQQDSILAGASEAEIAQAEADVQAAFIAQKQAQDSYDVATGWAYNADPDYQARFPISEQPINSQQVENAGERLDMANANLAASQAVLDDLLNGPEPNELQVAQAQVWVAVAERDAAQAYIDLLQAGPRPEDITLAEARVSEAESGLDAALAARDRGILRAPFSGTVMEIYLRAGEFIGLGQPAILLAGEGELQVETTDLNEIDVARVQIGAPVTITFEALPGETVTGTVLSIAPKSTPGAGVNYRVRITLDRVPEELRSGMTAFVDIAVE
jgi:HlyD family secretion protein